MPKITIGFPVYNGADTIEASMRCVLDGSFKDIEVLVSDNGSTDGTLDIVSKIAGQDERVKVITQPTNLGAVGNFRFLAEQASCNLFAWRAHDDLSDPDYFEVLYQKIERSPKAVLAASHIRTTKTKREKLRPFTPRIKPGETARWSSITHVQAAWVYGLFRTEFIQRAIAYTDDDYGHLFGCDMIMLLQAMLEGGIVGTNDTSFNQRCLVLGKPEQQADKALRRKIVADFYHSSEKLASMNEITGIKRQAFRIMLWKYIFDRVIRWQKLI